MIVEEFLYSSEGEKLVFLLPPIKNPMMFSDQIDKIYAYGYTISIRIERIGDLSCGRKSRGFPKRRALQRRCRAWIRTRRKRALDFMEPVPTVSNRARPLANGFTWTHTLYAYTLHAPARGACS